MKAIQQRTAADNAAVMSSNVIEWTLWPVWLVASFIGASWLMALTYAILHAANPAINSASTMGVFMSRIVMSVCMVLLFVVVPWLFFKRSTSLRQGGVWRELYWKDILLAAAGFILYILLAAIAIKLAMLVPGFDAKQAQDIGIKKLYGTERILAFIVFAVVTPLFEEYLFRGVLYGKLRDARMPMLLASILVSILFGLAHAQWNVGIDVFCLSLVACVLRELTGTIWPGVILHMIKNSLAFYMLFVIGASGM